MTKKQIDHFHRLAAKISCLPWQFCTSGIGYIQSSRKALFPNLILISSLLHPFNKEDTNAPVTKSGGEAKRK
jgi:hypothetical protein